MRRCDSPSPRIACSATALIAPSSAGARGGICCAPISPPAPAKAGGDLAIRPIETPDGFLKLETGRITASTLSRHLSRLGYDHKRMIREPPAIRFQAEHSNAIWHFDISSSDLKQLKAPPWIEPDRQGAPSLMLFSGVDDRSGVTYQEYRCVYGEDCCLALTERPRRAKVDPFQGIPSILYLDNGPVAKSVVFKHVMAAETRTRLS